MPAGKSPGSHSRHRRPALIKELEGNRAQRGRDTIKPEPKGIGLPTEPTTLDPKALGLWRAVVSSLPVGLLSRADDAMLEMFAREWALWRECDARIRKTGLIMKTPHGPVRNPLLVTRNFALQNVSRLSAALGLSPLARARLIAATEAEDPDPLALLLGDDNDPNGAWSTLPKTRQ